MSTAIHKLLIVIRIRFQGLQGSKLMNFWNYFLSKSIGDIVENNDLAFSLPYPQNPRQTVLFFGADSSGSISQLDESFLKASLEWTTHLTENGKWELDWDFSVYDFSAGAMEKYRAGEHIQPTASENGIIGLVNSESMESIEKRLISNPRTKLIFKGWFARNGAQ
jgi:hypothetical protein